MSHARPNHRRLVARDTAGVLWLYLGKGDGTFTARTKIGGWNAHQHLVGDADRDGRPDLVGFGPQGEDYLYRGPATGRPRSSAGSSRA
ncbi:FG-GAP repeat domain-containing protein [Streptomyces sp. PanSC19]|uniref:FG-GAP repeat domain-containing protein n=1 Tax=Streptomyces sp. PanSC19 TaxID=1520455 RepID=UPI0037D998D1